MPIACTTRTTGSILGSQIEVATLPEAAGRILTMAAKRRPAYICFATAHMLVKGVEHESIHRAYAEAAMVTPDGVPVAWALRLMGHRGGDCISGPRMMPVLLRQAAQRGVPVGFYGGRPETLSLMLDALRRDLPALEVVYALSPPFRPLDQQERATTLATMKASGVQLLFIGLGSPKQELWMHEHSPLLDCVCLGVGAAFEFLSGEKVLPPLWVQRLGLTWLVRLCQEPRRLAIRNLYSPIFVALFALQRIFGVHFEKRFASTHNDMVPGSPAK